MISTKVNTGSLPKTLTPGIHKGVEVKEIKLEKFPFGENAYHVVMLMEGPEIEGFEGFYIDNSDHSKGRYKGQIGNVKSSRWAYSDSVTPSGYEIKRDVSIVKFLNIFCKATDCEDWLIAQDNKHDTIESLVETLNNEKPFAGKLVDVCIGGREYKNKAGYINYDLYLPKAPKGFNVIEPHTEGESKTLMPFDPATCVIPYVEPKTSTVSSDITMEDTDDDLNSGTILDSSPFDDDNLEL